MSEVLELSPYYKIALPGQIIEKSVKNDRLVFSGYVSTVQVDLTGDVCPAESWVKHLAAYNKNPIYCFNHDRTIPIGRCKQASVDANGLLFEEITLTPIPFVKDVLSLLIMDDVLKQQSVGFMNIKKSRKGDLTILEENYLLEGSLVSVAMNPNGTDIKFKGIDLFTESISVASLWDAYDKGLIEVTSKFYVPDTDIFSEDKEMSQNTSDITMPNPNLSPSFKGLEVTKHVDTAYDPEGVQKEFPKNYPANATEYTQIAEKTHAAQLKNKFIFQIGYPTEKGFAYDWNLLAISTAKILGAKGGASFDDTEQKQLLERLQDAYLVLGKEFPQYEKTGESMAELAAWKLPDIKYIEVKFLNDEQDIVADTIAKENVDSLVNYLEKNGSERIKLDAVVKYLSSSVNVSISQQNYGDTSDSSDCKLITQILTLLNNYNQVKQNALKELYGKDDITPGDRDSMYAMLDNFVTNCLNDMDLDDSEVGLEDDEIVKGKAKKTKEDDVNDPQPLAVAAATEGDEIYIDPNNTMGTVGLSEEQGVNDLNPEIRNRDRNVAEGADTGPAKKPKSPQQIEDDNKKTRKQQNADLAEDKKGKESKYNHMAKRPGKDSVHYAGPHESFPIETQNDVDDAWDLRGHADNPKQVGSNILRLASQLGLNPPKGYHGKDKAMDAEGNEILADENGNGKKKPKNKNLDYLDCVKYLAKDDTTRFGYIVGTTKNSNLPVILLVDEGFNITKKLDITNSDLIKIPNFNEAEAYDAATEVVKMLETSFWKAFNPIKVEKKISKKEALDRLDSLLGL